MISFFRTTLDVLHRFRVSFSIVRAPEAVRRSQERDESIQQKERTWNEGSASHVMIKLSTLATIMLPRKPNDAVVSMNNHVVRLDQVIWTIIDCSEVQMSTSSVPPAFKLPVQCVRNHRENQNGPEVSWHH